MDDKIYNPYFDLSGDFIWIRNNLFLILRFIVENTVFGFSFSPRDEVDKINGELAELYVFDLNNWKSIVFQVVTGLVSVPLLLFALAMVSIGSSPVINHLSSTTVTLLFLLGIIPIGIMFPPLLVIAFVSIVLLILYFLLRILESFKMQRAPRPPVTRAPIQTFFLNGICVNEYWAKQNCLRITRRLGEKVGTVTPIENPSYGIVADLIESIIMRNFRVNSTAVCVTTDAIERALRVTEEGDIVRLIPHSQGTIIANLAVQRLYYRLSLENKKQLLKRLHIHTFAYADRNFINPEKLLGGVEHYLNKDDPVVRAAIDRVPRTGDFDGNIFVNANGKGHLFNKYYSLKSSNYQARDHSNSSELLS
jgi:hypothetical protein